MSQSERFTVLRAVDRVWAVGAIHGEADRLAAVHDRIAADLRFNDRIVYLGNYFGHGPDATGVLEELLRFRTWFLSHPPFRHVDDFVFLRGAQEEMWWKLMQLQFAPNPVEILRFMAQRGTATVLQNLGFDLQDGVRKAEEGALALTYWTNRLRDTVRALPGHDAMFSVLKRAAYSADSSMLFIHAGIDVEKPLAGQADAFWWAAQSFDAIDQPYRGFRRVIRSFDPDARGILEGQHTISVDAGAGRGGTLATVLLSKDGEIDDRVIF